MGNAFAYLPRIRSTEPWIVSHEFKWDVFILTLLTTLFLQILSNLANDYGDAVKGTDNENRIGPERAIQSGAISAAEMKKGIIVSALLALVSGLFLLYVAFKEVFDLQFLIFLILGLLSIAAAIKYTVGKGAYGYRALGDLFVFIFFGLVGVAGSYYLQVGEAFDWTILLLATVMGCFCVMVLNLNNMRDRLNDAKSGKRTLPVILGFKGAKYYHYGLAIIAWVISGWLFGQPHLIPWSFMFLPLLLIHGLHLVKVAKTQAPKEFDPELKKIALSAFLFSIITWIFIVLI
jgi:1,4-dihydroxy-2-naphthoate octaprenyltransferase